MIIISILQMNIVKFKEELPLGQGRMIGKRKSRTSSQASLFTLDISHPSRHILPLGEQGQLILPASLSFPFLQFLRWGVPALTSLAGRGDQKVCWDLAPNIGIVIIAVFSGEVTRGQALHSYHEPSPPPSYEAKTMIWGSERQSHLPDMTQLRN